MPTSARRSPARVGGAPLAARLASGPEPQAVEVRRPIRTRVLLLVLGLVVVAVGAVAVAAAVGAGQRAEARTRAELSRAATSLAEGSLLRSDPVLRRVSRFLGAEVVRLSTGGRVISATFRPQAVPWRPAGADAAGPLRLSSENAKLARRALERAVQVRPGASAASSPWVREADLGQPVTLAVAPVGTGGERLALVYPGSRISEARWRALRPALALAAAGLLLAAIAAVWVSRQIVRPIERLARAAARIERGDLNTPLAGDRGDEVAALAGALERMVRGLRAAEARAGRAERLAALGSLFASLAHEVKNPLAALRMTAELLRERLPEGADRDAVGRILTEIERLSFFAAKLLTYARGPVLRLQDAPLEPLVHEVSGLLAVQLEHLGVSVAVVADPALPPARIDPVAFRHLLMNLVLNAADAMPTGGVVRIRLASADPRTEHLELRISDDGPGLAPSDEERVFEPFFSRKPGGTGLGLAVARTIAEAHGGSLDAVRPDEGSAATGSGAIFRVRVPSVHAEHDLAAGGSQPPGEADGGQAP